MNHNERNKQYYHEKREQLILMLGGKCAVCGETNYDLLEFDHINPFTKSLDVSAHLTSTKIIQSEISKLQLLCIKCHKNKSDIDKHVLKQCGVNNPSSKLTTEQVAEIREKYSPNDYSYKMLAVEYGVSKTTIINIVNNKNRVYL